MEYKTKKIFHILGFCVVFVLSFFIMENLFFNKYDVPYYWQRVQENDREIDVLVLGNSNAYTSINAAVLEKTMENDSNLKWEVFASPSQNMVVTLEYLKMALKHKKPKYVILEVWSPATNNREALMNEQRGGLIQALDGVDSYFDKFCILTKTVKWQNILEGMFQLCRPTNMWSRWNFKRNKTYRVSADHGYTGGTLVTYASGTKTVKEIEEERKEAYLNNKYKWIADYNQEALVEFFRITQKNDIDVILYKSPIMQAEDAAVINNIFSIGKSYNNVKMCWDACCSMEKIGLSIDDFYDSLHLNKRGGEKFTYYFGNLFSESFDEDVDWNNVFAYRGESVRQLPDKSFEYSMDNYSKDTLYKFELYNKNDVIDSTDYSEKNSYICDIDVRESEEYSLYCYMISKKSFNEERYAENIKNKFMKQNKCVIK